MRISFSFLYNFDNNERSDVGYMRCQTNNEVKKNIYLNKMESTGPLIKTISAVWQWSKWWSKSTRSLTYTQTADTHMIMNMNIHLYWSRKKFVLLQFTGSKWFIVARTKPTPPPYYFDFMDHGLWWRCTTGDEKLLNFGAYKITQMYEWARRARVVSSENNNNNCRVSNCNLSGMNSIRMADVVGFSLRT